VNNSQSISNNLQIILDNANLANTHQIFFPILHEFAIKIVAPALRVVIKKIGDKSIKPTARLRGFEDAALMELKAFDVEMRGYLKNKNVTGPCKN